MKQQFGTKLAQETAIENFAVIKLIFRHSFQYTEKGPEEAGRGRIPTLKHFLTQAAKSCRGVSKRSVLSEDF